MPTPPSSHPTPTTGTPLRPRARVTVSATLLFALTRRTLFIAPPVDPCLQLLLDPCGQESSSPPVAPRRCAMERCIRAHPQPYHRGERELDKSCPVTYSLMSRA